MKKILVLTPRLPYPVIGGDRLRIYNICKFLAAAGHQLYLRSFVESEEEASIAQRHDERCIFQDVRTVVLTKRQSFINTALGAFSRQPLQLHYYDSNKMNRLVRGELESGCYQSVLVHLVRMAPYVENCRGVRRILEMTDAISLNYMRNREVGKAGLLSKLYDIDEKRVRAYEKRCIEAFDDVVVVSTVDRDYLLNLAGERAGNSLHVISNGVNELHMHAGLVPYDENLIAFVGNMRTVQNSDSVLFFVRDIFPLLKQKRPGLKLRILGADPPEAIARLNGRDGIEVTGRVDCVVDLLQEASVSICPMRIGAGVQNKVLESMALGVPVVTSSIGAEGLEAEHGKHLLIADAPEEFCVQVISLMENKTYRNELSLAGKDLITRLYGWDRKLGPYLEII